MELKIIKYHNWIRRIALVVILLPGVIGNWMYLGVASLGGYAAPVDDECNKVPGLVSPQLEVCKNNPQSLLCISDGARKGILECQKQFKFERWNCSATKRNTTVFGEVLRRGTRETAFIHAILSAGVVHATTQSCSSGNLTDCSCDMSYHGKSDVEGWTWGGCSDNIKYGIWFAETFVDAPEKMMHADGRNIRNMMNLHNNAAGRHTVEKLMRTQCRCHGVSGSCQVKTCWRGLPSFRQIGQALKQKYERSVQIARRSMRKLKRKNRDRNKRRSPISSNELVYVHRSPNYCREDSEKGILGTRGRICNRTSAKGDSCDLLCCGRGYNTQVIKYLERCHCKFIWCCEVECKTCETIEDIHTCK